MLDKQLAFALAQVLDELARHVHDLTPAVWAEVELRESNPDPLTARHSSTMSGLALDRSDAGQRSCVVPRRPAVLGAVVT